MGRIYTTLPLNDPTRQRYQNIIDNSRKQLADQKGTEGNKKVSGSGSGSSFDKVYDRSKDQGADTGSPSAQVRDGKIVDTWSDRQGNTSDSWETRFVGSNDQQQALKELYEMMRGGYFGNGLF